TFLCGTGPFLHNYFAVLKDRAFYTPAPGFLRRHLEIRSILSRAIDDSSATMDFYSSWSPGIVGFDIVNNQLHLVIAARDVFVFVGSQLMYPADKEMLSIELKSHGCDIGLESARYGSNPGESLRLQVTQFRFVEHFEHPHQSRTEHKRYHEVRRVDRSNRLATRARD